MDVLTRYHTPDTDAVERRPNLVTIGVDLGQRADPTAIAVVEYDAAPKLWRARLVERLPLGTSYRDVAARIGWIYRQTAVRLATEQAEIDRRADLFTDPAMRPPVEFTQHEIGRERITIYIDATGGGIPATEIIRAHPDLEGVTIVGVFLTSGERCTVTRHAREGSVGKAHLVGRLQSLLQPPARIELPPGEESEALKEELRTYEIHQSEESGALTAGAFKTGTHDDLATALGLAVLIEPVAWAMGTVPFAR